MDGANGPTARAPTPARNSGSVNLIRVTARKKDDYKEVDAIWLGHDRYRCPHCKKGYFQVRQVSKHSLQTISSKCESCEAWFSAEKTG